MRLRAVSGTPATVEADVLAVPIYREDADISGDLAELDAAAGGAITDAMAWGEFNVLEHPCALIDAPALPSGRLLLLNAGARGRGAWRARRLAQVATHRSQHLVATLRQHAVVIREFAVYEFRRERKILGARADVVGTQHEAHTFVAIGQQA